MEPPVDLTVVVVQGDAPRSSVVATVRTLCASPVPVAIEVVAASEPERELLGQTAAVGGLQPAGAGRLTLIDPSIRPLALPADRSGRFVGVLRPGITVLDGAPERLIAALSDQPEALLAVTGTAGDPLAGEVAHRRADVPVADGERGLCDGRDVARSLVVGVGPFDWRSSMFVVRTSVLNDIGDGLVLYHDGPTDLLSDWLRTVCLVLLRGHAWSDPCAGVAVDPRSPDEDYRDWQSWSTVLDWAAELGILADERLRSLALAEHTRRGALLLEHPVTGRPAFEHGPMLVRQTTALWRSMFEAETSGRRLLPLSVVVTGGGDADGLTSSVEAASAVVREVTELQIPAAPVSGDSGVGVPTSSSGGEARALDALVALDATSDLPVLLLRAGEYLDILDREQLVAALEETGPSSVGSVMTPSGTQPRLVWPGSTRAPLDHSAPIRPVHALRLGTDAVTGFDDWLPRPRRTGRFRTTYNFVIVAPDYTEIHGGVVALHRLCDRLNGLGYESYLEPIGANEEVRPGWLTPLRRGRSLADSVVIYPEIVTGNLLSAPRVVRWLLNRPAWFTGAPMEEGPDDLIVAFNPQISPDHPLLSVPLIDPTVFFPKDHPGHGGLLWIGKGTLPPEFDRSGVTLITERWPAERSELASLLRRAEVLYTCDWLTSVIDEALMCGTPVVLIGDQVWSRDEVVMRDGMVWEGHTDMGRARHDASRYFPRYLETIDGVDDSIDTFVDLVNVHFDSGARVGTPDDGSAVVG